jgi:glycosyltransferase 2 family protein
MAKHWIRLSISFGLSLFFLYLTFFVPHAGAFFKGEEGLRQALFGQMRFDLSRLGYVLATAHWIPVWIALALFMAALFVRAWRWRIMLRPLAPISYGDVFSAMNIGYFANNVLPMRMGEIYRAHVVYELSGISRSAAFGSIVLERMADLISMLPYLIASLLLFPLPRAMQAAAWTLTAVGIVLMAFMFWLVWDRERSLKMAGRLLRVLPPRPAHAVLSLLDKFTSGLTVLGRTEHFLALSVSSLMLWALYAGMDYCVFRSLGFFHSGFVLIDQNPIGAVLVILMITTIGFSIPGAPGAVGTYHGMAVLGLSLFAVPGDRAVGYAILLHALNYIPLTVLGLIFFWKLGLTFRGADRLATEPETPAGSDTEIGRRDEIAR